MQTTLLDMATDTAEDVRRTMTVRGSGRGPGGDYASKAIAGMDQAQVDFCKAQM